MSRRLPSSPLSQRALFTGLMSVLATVFGSYVSVSRIFSQADVISDILKIGTIIAVGTAVLSFVFWTLCHIGRRRPQNPLRGAVAGLLTAFCVVPLPVFAWKLKTDLLAAYSQDPGAIMTAFIDALLPAIQSGLQTYEVVTKAGLAALILSAALGYAVARFASRRPPAGTSPRQR